MKIEVWLFQIILFFPDKFLEVGRVVDPVFNAQIIVSCCIWCWREFLIMFPLPSASSMLQKVLLSRKIDFLFFVVTSHWHVLKADIIYWKTFSIHLIHQGKAKIRIWGKTPTLGSLRRSGWALYLKPNISTKQGNKKTNKNIFIYLVSKGSPIVPLPITIEFRFIIWCVKGCAQYLKSIKT